MEQAIEIDSDFGATMHELSAEAVTPPSRRPDTEPSGMTALIGAVYALNQRIEALEESVLRKFEMVHFERIEEQLSVIRDSETVNQKLFDSLHQELISYRDNFVPDALQKPFIRVLFDDLSAVTEQLGAATEKGIKPGRAEPLARRRKLEIALQQPADHHPRLECAELHLQRSRFPDRLRVRPVDVSLCAVTDAQQRPGFPTRS